MSTQTRTSYLLAATGLARVLTTLGLGSHQLGAPLPIEMVDLTCELNHWAVNIKQELRLIHEDEPWS